MLVQVLLAPLALSPQAPELLPPLPDGWRLERIELPLDFAPELEYEGVEELAFAPGMFAPDADTYFSYAFAIRLDESLRVDAEFLASFLTTYYRGLCRAVGADRQLELDLSAVAVTVEDERPFVARAQLYDPFTTGAPLALRLELAIHPGPGTTELFGIASPRAMDAPVWKTLRAYRDAWSAARPLPVFLNHAYVVPDQETYDAVAACEVLRELAVFEQRTTVRRDMSYTGLYFYGRETYFELLQPGTPAFVEGGSGVAFGVEAAAGTDAVVTAVEARGIQCFEAPITRALDGQDVPWFRLSGISAPHARSRLQLFTLEYDPAFLKGWHGDLPPSTGGITRAAVLQRYAAHLGRTDAPFQDVTAVHLALDPEERARFLTVGEVLGYRREDADGASVLHAPGARFVVRPSANPGGITALELSFDRAIEREPLKLGGATLTFAGTSATLAFD